MMQMKANVKIWQMCLEMKREMEVQKSDMKNPFKVFKSPSPQQT